MTAYIDTKRYPVSCQFGVPRASGPHQGQDHGCPRGTPLYSPEPGHVQYAIVRQHGEYNPDLTWPDHSWWPYSRYYEWWAGGLCIVYGQQYTHLFLHIDPSYIYNTCRERLLILSHQKHRKPGDYSAYVTEEITWQPAWCGEGDVVAVTRVSGYDDGPHVHYQLMAPGRNAHQVLDPRTVWS